MKKLFINSKLVTILLLLIFLFQFFPARAQDELSDAQVQERLQLIQQMLVRGKPNANRWWYGWLIGYSAATIGQGAVWLTSDDKNTRQDMALGTVTTFLGVMGQIITPMTPGTAPDRLARISEDTPQERRDKLLKAEKLLKKCALREKEGRSWKMHALTGIADLGCGLIVWLGFKRNIWEGVGNFALNLAFTEIQIWTQPTRAITDYDNYIKKYKSGEQPDSQKSKLSWSVSVSPGRLGINFQF